MVVLEGPASLTRSEPDAARTAGAPALVVLRPAGVLDRDVLQQLDEDVAAAAGAPVIVDLTECTLSLPGVVAQLTAARWHRRSAEVCLVCRRLSSRRVLARVGVPLVVFNDVRDATQSLVLRSAGYGPGWA